MLSEPNRFPVEFHIELDFLIFRLEQNDAVCYILLLFFVIVRRRMTFFNGMNVFNLGYLLTFPLLFAPHILG